MELTALLKALQSLPDRGANPAQIYTDSVYVWKGATRWVWKWIDDEELDKKKNPSLWAMVAKQMRRVRPALHHVDREEVDRAHRIAEKHRICQRCKRRTND
jgi:ribonuclease HI